MKKLRFQYETELSFSDAISRHFFVLRFIPMGSSSQKICSVEYEISPTEHISVNHDCFGNTTVIGRMIAEHTEFKFHIAGIAFTDVSAVGQEPLHPVYKYSSPYTEMSGGLTQFYEKNLSGEFSDGMQVMQKASVIMQKISAHFSYCAGTTTVKTTAAEAFQIGTGVCQDYAHICIALCRYAGIPARYVAGLMLGEGATHAWVEVYEDEHWIGIDPTHNRMVNDDYIKISQGRDYGDCMVQRGTFVGIAEQEQKVYAKVEDF